jgi:hypothetical protein
MIGVFGIWAATRPHKGRLAPRSWRMKVVLVGVVMTALAFFVTQVYRGNHESSRVVTAGSSDRRSLEDIATSSVDIATPYAAVHEQHFGLLLGESYLQLPMLFMPKVATGGKALSPMTSLIQAVTVPGTGAAVPLWAAAVANFGLIGLLAFGAILGWVVTFGHRRPTAHGECRGSGSHRSCARFGAKPLLMFFALYEAAAIVLPIWTISRWRQMARLR